MNISFQSFLHLSNPSLEYPTTSAVQLTVERIGYKKYEVNWLFTNKTIWIEVHLAEVSQWF